MQCRNISYLGRWTSQKLNIMQIYVLAIANSDVFYYSSAATLR